MRRPAARSRSKSEPGEQALATRIASAPMLSSPTDAEARVADWLRSIATTAPGKALKPLLVRHRPLRVVLDAIAESSPFLWDLVRDSPGRFLRLVCENPDEALPSLLSGASAAIAATHDEADVMRILRQMKAEAALLIALADIGGVWPVMDVTRALTDVADTAVGAAVRYLLADAARRRKLAPGDLAHPEQGSGYIVLAMGKMGAFELNYSSDIDLIVFYDPAASALDAAADPGQLYVRLTRSLVKILQERTADGYVFRVDLRLRPDPSSTQIAISTPAALDYYESRGQNWERAAMIKARPCAGDLAAGEALLGDLAPFIWRKYLDFAAVADVHAMKRQIHAYRGHGEIAVEGHNVKLGRGGIREIEFFAQTQQLIAGGRHPELHDRATIPTLATLADGGWIDAEARDDLAASYGFLRSVEHRLQMVADEQTHTLPDDPEALGHFARFLGFKDRDDFAAPFLAHLHKVQGHYARLFEKAPQLVAEQRNLSFAAEDEDRDTLDKLAEMGFRQPREVYAAVRRWLSGRYNALKGEQARDYLAELVPLLLEQFRRGENPDGAVADFDRFLVGLRAGGRFLSLLRQNPELLRFVALILGVAPRLADILAQQPQVIDPLIDPTFFGALPDEARLETELTNSLGAADSYEDFLDNIRLFGQEHMFLIGARILSGTVSAEQAGQIFARLADVLIRSLHRTVEKRFAAMHGHIRGQDTAILALGRLGAREMTATSDLDLIVVYDFDADHPSSDGDRPLYGGQYFARLTQRLINALTTPTNQGVLYPVDMRLRPSGRSGPLATQIDGFASYQDREAWTWEHMALTRARVVSASRKFSVRIEAVIREVLCRQRDADLVAADVVEMRRAIAAEKGDANRWDLKYAAGALVDIEFIVQYLQLVHAARTPEILDTSTARVLDKVWRLGLLRAEDAETLRRAVRLYHDLTQILRLCVSGEFDPQTASAGVLALLARAADVPDFAALEAHLAETQGEVRRCFVRILGKAP
jgi:glutamate-ammonia-ligase adenylyltransferase